MQDRKPPSDHHWSPAVELYCPLESVAATLDLIHSIPNFCFQVTIIQAVKMKRHLKNLHWGSRNWRHINLSVHLNYTWSYRDKGNSQQQWTWKCWQWITVIPLLCELSLRRLSEKTLYYAIHMNSYLYSQRFHIWFPFSDLNHSVLRMASPSLPYCYLYLHVITTILFSSFQYLSYYFLPLFFSSIFFF